MTTVTQIPRTAIAHNPKLLVEALRAEAVKNPVFNAVCHIFAIRERARQQVTLSNLRIRMSREGFHFPREQYVHVLQTLASLGIGTLDIDSDKRVRSLKNIKFTLQSIGLAAVGSKDSFERFSPSPDFKQLPVQPQQASAPSPVPLKARSYPTTITVNVEGMPMSVNMPKELTVKELMILMKALTDKKGEV